MTDTLEARKERLLSQSFQTMVPTLTPFLPNGDVNLSAIPRYASFLRDHYQADGIYVNGTTGEGLSLTYSEKLALTKAWIDARPLANPGLLIIANCNSTCVKECLELARECEKLGVDGIALLPPLYYKPLNCDQLIQYLKLISSAAPNTPIIYYNNSARVLGLNVDMVDLIQKGVEQIPQFVGMKFSSQDIAVFGKAFFTRPDKFRLFSGTFENLIPSLAAYGCTGSIVSTLNFPSFCNRFKQLGKSNDLNAIRQFNEDAIQLNIELCQDATPLENIKRRVNEECIKLGVELHLGTTRPPISY